MLITLANRSFLKRNKRFKLWKTVLLIERSFSAKSLKIFRNQYAVCLPNKSTSDACLLTIKAKEKSKAFIRYSTIRNWKRFMKKVIRILKEDKLKATQLLEKWSKAHEIKVKTQIKEKKPFDWSLYPSKQIKPRPPIIKRVVERNEDLKITAKTPLPAKSPVPPVLAKSPVPPVPAKSPVPPVPVKIISTGETKQMNAPKLIVSEPEPAPTEVTRPISAIKPTSRPSTSQKKTFVPNQTNRVYSPVNTSYQEMKNSEQTNQDTNKIDLSDIKRPPSSASKNASSDTNYIKNETYPEFRSKSSHSNEPSENVENKNAVDAENAENISMGSGSVSIKPTLSPESNDTTDQMNEQTNEA